MDEEKQCWVKAICNQEIEHENQKIMKLFTRHST